MTRAYVDSSVIVAIAFEERTAPAQAQRLRAFDAIHSAQLLEAELRSALCREQREFNSRLVDAIGWVSPARSLSPEIETVLAAGYLRGADCWHLATALYLSPDPGAITFLTLDARQRDVAKLLGFVT